MKNKFAFALIFTLFGLIILLSSAKRQSAFLTASTIETGLKYIPASIGMFQVFENEKLQESGVLHKVNSFYIWSVEVSNKCYREYLGALLNVRDTLSFKKALPDTLVWRDKLGYNEPYVDYYFRHPAYDDYPVVGLTYDQCMDFCRFLTKFYRSIPSVKYKGAEFDLPTETEWCFAAGGGQENAMFPWGTNRLQNSKGQYLANYRQMSDASIKRSSTNPKQLEVSEHADDVFYDNATVTAPVTSYWPNNYGLYNTSGNVEEFVKEKGISKGGSWKDTGYYLKVPVKEFYDSLNSASNERGFRFVMRLTN